MKTYRSTTLRLFTQNCPKALWHYEHDTPRDRQIFQTGIAAHAVLQGIGERAVALGHEVEPEEMEAIGDAITATLITAGRAFDGAPEPPMPPDAAFEGREIALRWASGHALPSNAIYERGLGIDAQGRPTAYGAPETRYHALTDVHYRVFEEEDEESSCTVAQIDEYKTAWPTSLAELDTVQTRGHAVILAAHFPEAQVIRRRVHNLRTWGSWTHEIDMGSEDDRATLDRWRRDILMTCDAADQTREARPGANCLGCDYAHACDDAWAVFDGSDGGACESYAIAVALVSHLGEIAKAQAAYGPIQVPGGTVGFHAQARTKALEGASRTLAHHWFLVPTGTEAKAEWDADNAELLGLLVAMKLGNAQMTNAVKALLPGRENVAGREDILAELVEETSVKVFGVMRSGTSEEMPDG